MSDYPKSERYRPKVSSIYLCDIPNVAKEAFLIIVNNAGVNIMCFGSSEDDVLRKADEHLRLVHSQYLAFDVTVAARVEERNKRKAKEDSKK